MSAAQDLAARLARRLDPETAHGLTLRALRWGLGPREAAGADPILGTRLAGLWLDNPIGLAAGFDKNAEAPAAMLGAGFGFVECGTATPLAQAGNPKPRVFRLAADGAVINRLGFNNAGQARFAANLARRPAGGVTGANIGANRDCADRIGDYVAGLRWLWGLCDYFTINVSSPNTPGLRDLQGGQALGDLLGRIREARGELAGGPSVPVFLKVSPDLTEPEVAAIVEAAIAFGLDGLVIANTTLDRPGSLIDARRGEAGGLSGAPLRERATRLLTQFREASDGRLVLIGVGGIASGADAYARIRAGASAVQLYTALIFHGPGLVGRIRRDLAARLRADGFAGVAEAVGTR